MENENNFTENQDRSFPDSTPALKASYNTASADSDLASHPANFGQAITRAYKNYLNFEGCASRSEYWFFQLFSALFATAVSFLSFFIILASDGEALWVTVLLAAVSVFAVGVPDVSLSVRRYHDSDHCGWWIFCPIASFVILFYSPVTNSPYSIKGYAPSGALKAGKVLTIIYSIVIVFYSIMITVVGSAGSSLYY